MTSFNECSQEFLAGLDDSKIGQYVNLLASKDIDFADIFFQKTTHESYSLEDSMIKSSSFAINKGVGVRTIVGSKSGFAYSDDISEDSLIQTINASKAIKSHCQDSFAIKVNVANKKPLYTSNSNLDIFSQEQKVLVLKKLDELCRKMDKRVIQVFASIAGSVKTKICAPTDGDFIHDIKPVVQIRCSVIMSDGKRQEIGSASSGGAFLYDKLIDDQKIYEIAKEAIRVASVNMLSVEAKAGNMPVVLASGWPGVLIHEAVGHGLEADFNRLGTSIYTGKIGQKVASEHCTIIDDGSIANRRGSLTYDDEGIAGQCNVLIEKGILKGYITDKQNARLLNIKPTGNGRRQNYNYAVQPRMTNTYMQNGKYTKEEIISSVKNGIYAVGFSGGQVDITSGKFVFSTSEAYKIENGKIKEPVKGATLIGSGMETMQQISMVGNDLEFDKGIGVCGKGGQSVAVGIGQPTLLIDNIVVGGQA